MNTNNSSRVCDIWGIFILKIIWLQLKLEFECPVFYLAPLEVVVYKMHCILCMFKRHSPVFMKLYSNCKKQNSKLKIYILCHRVIKFIEKMKLDKRDREFQGPNVAILCVLTMVSVPKRNMSREWKEGKEIDDPVIRTNKYKGTEVEAFVTYTRDNK